MKLPLNFFGLLLISFLFLCSANMKAQLFDAGFVLGPSFSQIEGDDVAGYKRVGINAGVMVEINFSELIIASMEILYSQKGSSSAFFNTQEFSDDFKIIHEYVEIPIIVNYQDKGGMNFGAGLVPAYHLRSRLFTLDNEVEEYFQAPDDVKKWGLAFAVNLSYRINRYSQANLRWTYDLFPYQDRYSNNRGEIVGQYNNSVALRYIFLMSAIGKKKL